MRSNEFVGVALLIDHDNLDISICNNTKWPSYDRKLLRWKAEMYGKLVMSKAYIGRQCLHNKNLARRPNLDKFKKLGIKPIIAESVKEITCLKCGEIRRKSIADSMIICDAMEILHHTPEISMFILVTGDKDFIPLIQMIDKHGKKAVVIGLYETTADRLIKECVSRGFPFHDYIELYGVYKAQRSGDEKTKI